MNNMNNQKQQNTNHCVVANNRHHNGYARVPTIFDLFSHPLTDFDFFSSPSRVEDGLKVDLKDCGDHYQLKADMPGVRKEDIKVDFEDGVLSISAVHHSKNETKDEQGYLIRERSEGTYQRQFKFEDADGSDIKAAFVGAELDIYVKKAQKKCSHSITIN